MIHRTAWPAAVVLALSLSGCATAKLLRLENEVLKNRTAELEAKLSTCRADARPVDFVTEVDGQVIGEYLVRAGYGSADPGGDSLYTIGIDGKHTQFQVSVQLFERENVLYFAVHDYLSLEDAASSQSMVLLLTQLATMNYDLLLGKFQLNPRSGDISLSVEVQVDDGLGYATFEAVLNHIIYTADSRHPDLLRAAQGRGI